VPAALFATGRTEGIGTTTPATTLDRSLWYFPLIFGDRRGWRKLLLHDFLQGEQAILYLGLENDGHLGCQQLGQRPPVLWVFPSM
jgi:hypothetical protein